MCKKGNIHIIYGGLTFQLCNTVIILVEILLLSGAIIEDGDHKHMPFLVLGLSLWYGTICLFVEQIVPSPATHTVKCCKDFCRCHARKWHPKFLNYFMLLAHNSMLLCLLEFCFKYFHVIRESSFNTRGRMKVLRGGGLWKLLDTWKGGSEKNCWARRGFQKFVYFKTNMRSGAPKRLNR